MRNWNAKPVRISLDLTPEERDELDQLVDELKTKTRSRLIRRALHFYGVLADHKKKGYLIQAIKGGSLLQFPDLDVPYPQEITLKKR